MALSALPLLACTPSDPVPRNERAFDPVYRGAIAEALDEDLIQITAGMEGARDEQDVADYADCRIAEYALSRGFGFARHLRTNVFETAGLWQADAVYTVSRTLPEGRAIDAEAQIDACRQTGIPLL